ncbi:hypothetical protein HCG51_34345 (plasmid) [Tolypothrix sp. PCC 7910]|uniref:hypothetical protein n=1 Tax=Tolypothrix sp. PCC 7910 TaxID=2099387 RepID=UPI0014278AE2|nr:hypothetical protein [Tolypothrix sp. PCC 7910]QIR41766.1 hypothetical protein HCG51_34345 [Tolypothrix sp. PCC 7910]
MTLETLKKIVNIASKIAKRKNQAITVFQFNTTYYMVDACEWENGRSYGQYIITVEPGKNPINVIDFAETFANQT